MTKLLIVDDNREMRQLIRSIVEKTCEQVFECEDGDEVLDAFIVFNPDLVLMDVEMKRMDGLKATLALTTSHPEAKVVIVTKHTDAYTREAATAAGARLLVSKDDLVSLRTLIQQLTN